jgi:hypothetical protein
MVKNANVLSNLLKQIQFAPHSLYQMCYYKTNIKSQSKHNNNLQTTLFGAIMAFSGYREAANRHSIICIKLKTSYEAGKEYQI